MIRIPSPAASGRRALIPLLVASLLSVPSTAFQEASTEASAPAEEAPEPPKPPKPSKRQKALFETEGSLPLEWVESLDWRSIGPANMGGRMTDIAVHPTDPSTYWVASASGGILKTTNRGTTYTHEFQDQAVSSIGAIAVSPAAPDRLWVGTGEPNPRNSVTWGDGVYRSDDGGETYQHVGLSQSFQIGAIVAHPVDPDTVYVAALGRLWGPNDERGLYKTTDAGATWERVLFVDEDTGVIDVIMKPGEPDTLIAATYERRRDGFDTNDPARKWGDGSGMWRTTDGGANWEQVERGLPTVQWGRVGMDWYQGDPNVVYAVIETERITQLAEDAAFVGLTGTDGGDVGVRVRRVEEDGPAAAAGFQVDDLIVTFDGKLVTGWSAMIRSLRDRKAGETASFDVMRGEESLTIELTFGSYPSEDEDSERPTRRSGPFSSGLGGQVENVQDQQGEDGFQNGGVYRSDDGGESWERVNSVNPRPMYYSQIRVDPSDDSYVYVLGTSLYRSSDGGRTFTSDGAGREVHVDHHALWIDPADGRHIVLGNDGGIYVTHDRMESWDHHNHMAMGQFYAVEADRRKDYRVFGGLQDNGSWGAPVVVGSGGPRNEDWFRVGGGDGFVCRVDPEDPDLVYYESQNGGIGRRHLGTGEMGFFRPRGSRGISVRFNWRTPFLLSNHNSRIYYTAGNHVYRSLDRGNDLRRISPEISFTDRGTATALAESPREPDILYVGTDDGALWRTLDGGVTWDDLFQLNPSTEATEEVEAGADAAEISSAKDDADLVRATLREPGQGAAYASEDDPVGGTWKAVARSADSAAPSITLELTPGEAGAVTGHVSSVLGRGEVRDGSFDRESGDLKLRGVVGGVGYTVAGTVKDGVLEARLTGGGGLVDVGFRAVRATDAEGTELEAPVLADAETASETSAAAGSSEEAPAADESSDSGERRGRRGRRGRRASDDAPKFIDDTIDQLLPGRFHVSSVVASHHKEDRVYATFDGHRSDDDLPHVYVSNDNGSSWESLRANLPDAAGSARVLVEDPVEEDLLFLGTEFAAFVSVDRGDSWTRVNNNLPTVPIHDFSINVASGEIVAGTHGRSLWVLEMSPLREMTGLVLGSEAHLYEPSVIHTSERTPERGSTIRRFAGESRPRGTTITYSLGRKAREVQLFVENAAGDRIAELSASNEKGLHRTQCSLRATRSDNQGRRRGGSRQVSSGTYSIVLDVDGDQQRVSITVP